MKRLKQSTALIMVLLMLLLSGCEDAVKEDHDDYKELITINVYSQRSSFCGMQGGWLAKILKDKFNVEINIVPDKGETYDKAKETGYLGDLCCMGEYQFMNAVENGLVLDLEEDNLLADYGSYIKEHEAAALDKSRNLTGGTLYGFGFENATSMTDRQPFLYTWELRWDLYKQLGYPEIHTLDDYIDLFKQMKEICPEDENGNPTYAFSLWGEWDVDMNMYVNAFASSYFGYDGNLGMGHYDPATGNWYGALDDNSPYLQILKFFNKLYRADLIDFASRTKKFETVCEKIEKGGTFASVFSYVGSDLFNTELHMEEGKMFAPMVIKDAHPLVDGQSIFGGYTYYAIGSKCAYPDRVMEVLNWLCTPEGTMTTYYGPQGLTWDYDENKNTFLTELGKKTVTNSLQEIPEEYGGGYYHDGEFQMNCVPWIRDASNPDSNGETYNYKNWKLEQGEAKYDIEADWRTWASGKTGTDIKTVEQYMASSDYSLVPEVGWVASEKSDELKSIWSQVATIIITGSWQAIYADSDDEYDRIVAEMIAEADKKGYDKVQKFCRQEADSCYKAWQKATAEWQ